MNKLIATLLVTACAGAMAQQFAVYDYSSSIKRLNGEVKKATFKTTITSTQATSGLCGVTGSIPITSTIKNTAWGERFVVKSDKITGYVQLPVCAVCAAGNRGVYTTLIEGDPYPHHNVSGYTYWDNMYSADSGIGSSCPDDHGFYGVAWLTRKGDKVMQNNSAYPIYKVVVRAEIGVFGSYVDITSTESGNLPLDGGAANKKAWMSLTYAMPDPAYPGYLSSQYFKSGTSANYEFGFLGWGNNFGTTVYQTGFGTVTTTKGDISFCASTNGCSILKQISGTITGWPGIVALCGKRAIWDLCDVCKYTDQSVISGTWTLKFNKTLTGLGAEASQAQAIVARMGGKNVWDTTDEDNNIGYDGKATVGNKLVETGVYFEPDYIPDLFTIHSDPTECLLDE